MRAATGASRAVDAVLARGLAKDPGARYPTGERLLQALGDALRTERGAATAPVPSVSGEPQRDQRRDPLLTRARLALGSLVVLIAAGAVVAGILASGGSSSPPHHSPAPATVTPIALGSGSEPVELTANASGAYVLDQFGQYVDVVDLGGSLTRISLPGKPRSLVLDPARKMLWVGLFDHRLVPVSLSSHKALGSGIHLPIVPDLLAVLGNEVVAEQGNPAELVRVDAHGAGPSASRSCPEEAPRA